MHAYQALFELNWNLLFSIITFLVLFLILYHFFFKKVHDFMMARQQEVVDSLNNAEETNRVADEKLADYEARIANVESESRDIIKKARDEAKVQADGIISEANEKARNAIAHSQEEIQREKFNARKELQEEVGNLAVLAAQQIIEREIDSEKQNDIVERIIKEAEEKTWN